MGAYCSVYNDTGRDIYIKYGANIDALRAATWAFSAFAVLVTAGAGAGLATAATATAIGVGTGLTGMYDLQKLSRNIIKCVAGVGMAAAGAQLEREMKKNGYSRIAPGGTYTSEKLTLSLYLQANIMLLENGLVKTGELDCWTGPTDDACNKYNASQASWTFTPK